MHPALARAARPAAVAVLAPVALFAALLAAPPARAAAPAAPAPRAGTGAVRVAYEEPKDPAHRATYERLRDAKFLDPFAEVLGNLRLPRPLTLKFAGCDGEVNAWYEASDTTVTFCYEFVADFEKAAEGAAAYGVSRDDAVYGASAYVLLHECGHALFDLLQVPLLGREEDAADHVAAWILLRAGKGVARRALGGAAWMYKHDSARALDESDYSDVHGLDAQRLYNVLCMAYGAHPAEFAGLVEKGYLPKDRAEGCGDEFGQVTFAVKKLILRSVDAKAAKRTFERHKAKWDAPSSPTPVPAVDRK
jgi:hypothetical protein